MLPEDTSNNTARRKRNAHHSAMGDRGGQGEQDPSALLHAILQGQALNDRLINARTTVDSGATINSPGISSRTTTIHSANGSTHRKPDVGKI